MYMVVDFRITHHIRQELSLSNTLRHKLLQVRVLQDYKTSGVSYTPLGLTFSPQKVYKRAYYIQPLARQLFLYLLLQQGSFLGGETMAYSTSCPLDNFLCKMYIILSSPPPLYNFEATVMSCIEGKNDQELNLNSRQPSTMSLY